VLSWYGRSGWSGHMQGGAKSEERGTMCEGRCAIVACSLSRCKMISTIDATHIYLGDAPVLHIGSVSLKITRVCAMSSQSPNPYGCPDSACGQNFAHPNTFYKHWTWHKDQCPFPTCKTRIDSKYNFERHCARKHGD
jgi:hypothetical protein